MDVVVAVDISARRVMRRRIVVVNSVAWKIVNLTIFHDVIISHNIHRIARATNRGEPESPVVYFAVRKCDVVRVFIKVDAVRAVSVPDLKTVNKLPVRGPRKINASRIWCAELVSSIEYPVTIEDDVMDLIAQDKNTSSRARHNHHGITRLGFHREGRRPRCARGKLTAIDRFGISTRRYFDRVVSPATSSLRTGQSCSNG